MEEYYTDLKLTRRVFNVQTSDREFVDMTESRSGDLQTVSGRDNLAQAIINRLLTRKGELARFGHARYGSRLYLLVGELNNLRTRARAELYIRECLQQESRIEEIVEVSFNAPPRTLGRSELQAFVILKPIEGNAIQLTIPITL